MPTPSGLNIQSRTPPTFLHIVPEKVLEGAATVAIYISNSISAQPQPHGLCRSNRLFFVSNGPAAALVPAHTAREDAPALHGMAQAVYDKLSLVFQAGETKMALATTFSGYAVSLLFQNAYTEGAPRNAQQTTLGGRICAMRNNLHYFKADNVWVLANLVVNIVQGTAWNFGTGSLPGT